MKIATVLGARPQFVKAAAFSREVACHNASASGDRAIDELLIHTGQHFDANMSDVFFEELGIDKPRYQLAINSGGHGEMTGRMLMEIEKVLMAEKPDAVLVYGDTNSTLAGALAAVKLQIPVAHVEAGLRSFNMAMPEEVNRILTDRISRWLFTPTASAAGQLAREGVAAERVITVGDVMYDVALHFGKAVGDTLLQRLGLKPKGFVLATIHRAENTDHPGRLAVIVAALSRVAAELPVVWPMHPRTRKILEKGRYQLSERVMIVEPLGYLDMVQLEKGAALIATDSGGVQKEAFFHRVPCVTVRDETEWVELVEAGWNRLAPPGDADALAAAILGGVGSAGEDVSPYGEGDAARRIVAVLARDLYEELHR